MDDFLITEVAVKFIREHVDLVAGSEFQKLYDLFEIETDEAPSRLTSLFLLSDVNPLLYLKTVPYNYAIGLPISIPFELPSHITKIESYAFSDCKKLPSISFPEGLTEIGGYAFHRCESLTEINLPSTLEYVGIGTFWGCSRLASVELGTGLLEVEGEMFAFCPSLTELTIPDQIYRIGMHAFRECKNLERLTIGEGVRTIYEDILIGCRNYRETIYEGTMDQWMQITINPYNLRLKLEPVICADGILKYQSSLGKWVEADL